MKTEASSLVESALRLFGVFILCHYVVYPASIVAVLWLLCFLKLKWLAACLVVLYIPYFFDGSQYKYGKSWPALRDHKFWRFLQVYFPTSTVKTSDLDPRRQYIFAWVPHGAMVVSRTTVFGGVWHSMFPGVQFPLTLGASPMFWFPGCREICLWLSAIDASRATAKRILSKGYNMNVYPGGSEEIFLTRRGEHKVLLSKRKGFVRLALEHGCDLVPIYVFGEQDLYNVVSFPKPLRHFFLKYLKFPLVLILGRFGTLIPDAVPLTSVFGEAIPVDKVENPTEEQINDLHARYVSALRALFDKHKKAHGAEDKALVVL